MGCLCSKRNNDSNNDNVQLINTTTNAAVSCKCGLKGEFVHVQHDLKLNRYSIEGSGTVIGSCALDCDTATWEVKLGKNPSGVMIGVERFNKKNSKILAGFLNDKENESDAFCLNHDGLELKEGDVVGIYWDQTDFPMLNFTINGKLVSGKSINRIRPASDIHPAVSIRSGSSCEIGFDGDHFIFPPISNKFKMIVCATSLI